MPFRWCTGRIVRGIVVPSMVALSIGVVTPSHLSAATCVAWTGPQAVSPGSTDNYFLGVAVRSPCDAWAVGVYANGAGGSDDQTLIEHWNGSSWSVTSSPDPGGATQNNYLTGVAAVSSKSVWTVGYYTNSTASRTLVEHWNGTSWKQVPSPNLGAANNRLNGVAAVSASNVWAVGDYVQGSVTRSLVLHWNGHVWKHVTSPNPGGSAASNNLHAVTAASSGDVWMVGESDTSTTQHTLVLHWNGHAWKHFASPNPLPNAVLDGVAATSAKNAWAVGFDGATASQTLVLRWNGHRWKHVTSPEPGGSSNSSDLEGGVTATSASNAWAVGSYFTPAANRGLTVHWNGTHWMKVTTANPGTQFFLYGVGASSATDVWTVGYYSNGSLDQALAIHCC